MAITRSETVAEELVQDVFLKIWTRKETLLTIDNFEAYLYIITRNEAYHSLKGIARHRKLMEVVSMDVPSNISNNDTEQAVYAREYQGFLNKAINCLPKQQQQVYHLIQEEGLSRKQVALQLHISPESVKTHLSRALKNIRTLFMSRTLIWVLAIFCRGI
jgi:RNA polymerase sigma-70 factor (ECF subfamily)